MTPDTATPAPPASAAQALKIEREDHKLEKRLCRLTGQAIVDYNMIGEGDKIAVEAETDGEMLNGRRYNNAYHFAFELVDGKLHRVREYSCSYLAQSCFGAVEPGNPEASKMAD